MPLTQCRANSEYSSSMTCTQIMPKSSWQILCKCKEASSQSHEEDNGAKNVHCNGTNCINRINEGANEFEHINGVGNTSIESEVLIKTRYINRQSTVVCISYLYKCVCVCMSLILIQFFHSLHKHQFS